MLTTGRFTSILVGLDTLRVNPLRTALSTLGIVMGSASLVAVLALGDGLQQFIRTQLARTTDLHAVTVSATTNRTVDGMRFPRADTVVFDRRLAGELTDALPGLAAVSLTLTGAAELGLPDSDQQRAAMVTALWYHGTNPFDSLAAGRSPTAQEVDSGAAIAVVSDTLARMISPGKPIAEAVGRTFRLHGASFTVVGVLPRRPIGERPQATIALGLADTAMAQTFGPKLPAMVVSAASLEAAAPLRAALEGRLAARYDNWKDRVTVTANDTRLRQTLQGMQVAKLVMGAITGISLLVGGVGIMNVLLAAVVERTREIGIRKAVGARRRDILVQFLSESVAIAGAGSLLGVILGLAGAFAATAIIRARTEATLYAAFTWSSASVSALAAIVVGLAFGCYPALRAARLSPIDAIRHE
jgi:putative ABC transport system permease protein